MGFLTKRINMVQKRKRHSAAFKAKVAREALKERLTGAQLASKFKINPVQVSSWKKQAIEFLPELFSTKKGKDKKQQNELEEALYAEIGRLKVELTWLKKKLGDDL